MKRMLWVCLAVAGCDVVPMNVGPISTVREVGISVVFHDPGLAESSFVTLSTPAGERLFEGSVATFVHRPIPLVVPADVRSLDVTVQPRAGGGERRELRVPIGPDGTATVLLDGAS